MGEDFSFILEVSGAEEVDVALLGADMESDRAIKVLPLDTREPALLTAFLVELTAGSTLTLATYLIKRLSPKKTQVHIKRRDGAEHGASKELVIETDDADLDKGKLAALIEDFLRL
jgi:hypothetical protein